MPSAHLKKKRCYLVDANVYAFTVWKTSVQSVDYRSEHAVYALFAFSEIILKLLKAARPAPLIFIYDGPSSRAYRQNIYPLYKANRPPTGEALRQHLQHTQQLLQVLGLPVIYSSGYEADDVIGTLVEKLHKNDFSASLITADKDLMQLLTLPEDRWWDFSRSMIFDRRAAENRFGVKPYRLAELLALTGDRSDNIPGVPGVSYNIGAKLINYFNGLENLLQNIDRIRTMNIRSAENLAINIASSKEDIKLAYKLASIVRDLPEEMIALPLPKQDLARLRDLFPHTHAAWQQIQRLEKALYEPSYFI